MIREEKRMERPPGGKEHTTGARDNLETTEREGMEMRIYAS